MEFRDIWVMRGGNHWCQFPAVEVELALDGLETQPTSAIPGFGTRLTALLARLDPHGVGEAFSHRLEQGTSLAHLLQHLTLLLQLRAGSDVAFGVARAVEPPTFYRVVVEFEEEPLVRACLEAAREMLQATLTGAAYDAEGAMRRLGDLAQDVRLGPSTGAIVRAARERNIPVARLNDGSLVQLGHGARVRRILTAETDRTGAIAEAIAQDKELTRSLLRSIGVPVPDGRPAKDAADAWEAAQEIGVPVVVKPQFGNHGRGVATNLTTREQVMRAYEAARQAGKGDEVIVETFIPGDDYRLLVVGDRLIAAARREPGQVIGDGQSSVRQLMDEVNKDPRRSDGHATVLSYLKLDAVALAVLEEQGYSPDAVPAAGERVLIRRNANLSTGGTATDVTDDVHPDVAARAVDAARVIGLDIAGVDIVVSDISQPLEKQRGGVVEVNAGPGLRMHLQPSAGKPRPVGEAIVDLLFPAGQTGRIPLAAVTGVNGKTTTTRLIAQMLRATGKVVGMTCTDGVYIYDRATAGAFPQPGGRRIDSRDCSGPRSARAVLLNPRVEAAVLETARGGILRRGLGFDRCDVAVVTNLGTGDHFGSRGVETLPELARVKGVVVEAVAPTGAAVLNAADPLVAEMASACPGAVVYFARDEATPVLASHRNAGGRAVFVRNGAVVLAEGHREETLIALTDVPLTHGGKVAFEVENVLAAVAAGWSLRVPNPAMRLALETFAGDGRQLPGRFNVYRSGGATVIVDYAHNPSALAALIGALAAFPAERRSIVFCPGNRRDSDVEEMGALLGDGFDRMHLYRDHGNPDRADGELVGILRKGMAGGKRLATVSEAASEREAIDAAFHDLRSGDLLVVNVEAIDAALSWVEGHLHRSEADRTGTPDSRPAAAR